MRKTTWKTMLIMVLMAAFLVAVPGLSRAASGDFMLGNEVLMADDTYYKLIKNQSVGLITNQSGVNSKGDSTVEVLAADRSVRLVALYGPEHGIDGTAGAGKYVESYIHPGLGIPVYSLYGPTRMPTGEMLKGVDVLIFDVQDIGARTYTYKSTLNYTMQAAEKYNKPILVLDRPNPLGGETVEGPVLEEGFETFVGVDNLPMAHGMTIGELAKFFNREIGADLTVVPMRGYTREMIYQDTGLEWKATSPNIPDLQSVFGYMATGLGEGTGIHQADQFKWIGGAGIDSRRFAALLNGAGLKGVTFRPEPRGTHGGVRLDITDYHKFNPARAGIYALAYARQLTGFEVPRSGDRMVMFDKVMGTDDFGRYLEQRLSPGEIEARYGPALQKFKKEREKYLIYGFESGEGTADKGEIIIKVDGRQIDPDTAAYIDTNSRTMVPLRFILEALGARVDWDAETRVVTVFRLGKKVRLKIDSYVAEVDGEQRKMDTVPVIRQGRTMVPLRYVSEFFDCGVFWDSGLRKVTIKTG